MKPWSSKIASKIRFNKKSKINAIFFNISIKVQFSIFEKSATSSQHSTGIILLLHSTFYLFISLLKLVNLFFK